MSIPCYHHPVVALGFGADDRWLKIVTSKGHIIEHDVQPHAPLPYRKVDLCNAFLETTEVARVSADGNWLVGVAEQDGVVKCWDVRDGRKLDSVNLDVLFAMSLVADHEWNE